MKLLKNNFVPTEYLIGNQDQILQEIEEMNMQEEEKRMRSQKKKELKNDIIINVFPGWEKYFKRDNKTLLSRINASGKHRKVVV